MYLELQELPYFATATGIYLDDRDVTVTALLVIRFGFVVAAIVVADKLPTLLAQPRRNS